MRTSASLQRFADVDNLARSYLAAEQQRGDPNSYMKRPPAGDAAAMRAAMHELGLPEAPYELSIADNPDAGKTELAKAFTSACYTAGIPPQLAQPVFEQMHGFLDAFGKKTDADREAREAADIEALRAKKGAALETFMEQARVVAEHYGVLKAINEAGLGTNPAILELLASGFAGLQEGSLGGAVDRDGGAVLTPDQYVAKAMEMQRAALGEKSPSRRIELSQQALRFRQLANAGR